jgi:hypothetical protein
MATQGPDAGDIQRGNSIADNMFRSQQLALNNMFQDQSVQANRQAALMGRSMNDPILAAKLAQEQTRQQGMLDAQKGAFGMNYAMNNRMELLGQRANVLGGLASQALANRQNLAAMGEGIMNNERQFRLATATHYGTQEQSSGGGLGGFLTGAIAGAGAGAKIAGGIPSFGGGGGGASPSTFDPNNFNPSPFTYQSQNFGALSGRVAAPSISLGAAPVGLPFGNSPNWMNQQYQRNYGG